MTSDLLCHLNLGCDQLESYQRTLLAQQFQKIYQSIPYYRTIFRDRQINPYDDPFENLEKMPYMSVQDYYKLSESAWRAHKNNVYLIDSSSGSTGKTKQRFLTLKDEHLEIEQMYRIFRQAGFADSRSILLLDVWFPNMYPLFVRAATHLSIPSIFSQGMGSDPLHTINQLIRFDIDTIVSIPTVIFNVVNTIIKENLETKIKKRVKKILFFGEQCPDSWRNLIKDKLGVEVFSYYGSTELGCIGSDCEYHSGTHVFEDMFHVELHNRQEIDGQSRGELVLTTLQMDGTPLIRYRTGDIVSLYEGDCGCGNPCKKIRILGRTDDMLSIYGSKYFMQQFDDIFVDHLSSPFYRLKLIPPTEGDNNYYQMIFYLPTEARAHEAAVQRKILALESMERYFMSGFLSISYYYLKNSEIQQDRRKFRRLVR